MPMNQRSPVPPIRPAPTDSCAAHALAEAFADDPALSWIIPDRARRRACLPALFRLLQAQSARHGDVVLAGEEEAAALWYPPGTVRDGPWATIADHLRGALVLRGALRRALAVAEAIHAHHPAPQPCLYLRFIGAQPRAQGRGLGGALLREGIARAEAAGCGILLETATLANVGLYARFGFSVQSEWDVPGGGPHFWTMIRPAHP
jgi:ribosomal protein S18 acetylase RimI-like enzyme